MEEIILEEQKNLFHLTKENIEKIKYIKLDKKASYYEPQEKSNQFHQNKYNEVKFYSFGFYDLITCFNFPQMTSLIDEKHFLISYPFEKKQNTLMVEQWFGIFPLAQETKFYSNISYSGNDPFFCESSLCEKFPFIGIVLISLNRVFGAFEEILTDYIGCIRNIFGYYQNNKVYEYIAEIYYSLNCADLCLVIRTDSLPFIHNINRKLEQEAEKQDYEINTTVIFAVQTETNKKTLTMLKEKNRTIEFIVRSNERYSSTNSVTIPIMSYGVNGTGKYVTKMKYEEYISGLPEIFKYKVDNTLPPSGFWGSICHEREWFEEESIRNIRSVSNAKLEGKLQNSRLQQCICRWMKDIHKLTRDIENNANQIFSCQEGAYAYKNMFDREFRLIKELIYTYSDLWYKQVSESGFVFFAQLQIALTGLQIMLDEIKSILNNKNNYEKVFHAIGDTLKSMHSIACDLNGYNKQFQFLSQDSVNFPSYEIQSKVNSEKYMAAYCSFLHKFFSLYYLDKDQEEYIVQTFPMALIDISQRKIVTEIFFSGKYKQNTKEMNKNFRSIFSVHFPSAEYFSNVRDTIPLLMHEASHIMHYGKIEKRNKAILFNIDHFFAEVLGGQIFHIINDGVRVNRTSLLSAELELCIYQALAENRKKFFEKEIDNVEKLNFTDLKDQCKKYYSHLFEKLYNIKQISYNEIAILKDKIKEDIDEIMQIIGFQEMCYAFNNFTDAPPLISYFINVLYLEFHPTFYKKYEEIYDNDFLESLNKQLDISTDEAEQAILTIARYRFYKYVQVRNNDVEDIFDEDIYIAFSAVLMASMHAIYQKYQGHFLIPICEKEYCEKLCPYIDITNVEAFTNNLKKTYQIYKDKFSMDSKYCHDKHLMKSMFAEYYEVYCRIMEIETFLIHEILLEENITDDFVQNMHDKFKKYIVTIEKSDEFNPILTKTNREQLVKLGFFEEKPVILKDVFTKVVSEMDSSFIENVVDDRISLFQEVQADCGMCLAMNFDLFGYCMFSLSIHNSVNDLTAMSPRSNFLADRIRCVARIFLNFSTNEHVKLLNEFLEKIFDREMVLCICKFFLEIKNCEEINDITNNLETKEYLQTEVENVSTEMMLNKNIWNNWRKDIIDQLLLQIEEKYESLSLDSVLKDKISVAKSYLFSVNSIMELLINEDVLTHILNDPFDGFFSSLKQEIERKLEEIQNEITGEKGIKSVREDKCVTMIRQFYNMEYSSQELDKFSWYYKIYCNRFIEQCNFVWNNYCEYRDAYHSVVREALKNEKLEIKQWFDIIDNYYQQNH